MEAAAQGAAAAASTLWAAHAAFAGVDTPVAQTMLSFLPTMAVSELSPQLLLGTLLVLVRGGFGDDGAVEEAINNLSRLNLAGLTWSQVSSLVTRVAAVASLLPLLSMAQDVVSARDTCVAALRSAGVTPHRSDTPPTRLRTLVAALPVHSWLRAGIEAQLSITYGTAPARERHRPARALSAGSAAPPALKHLKLDLLWHRDNLRRGPRGAPVLMYCHGGGWVVGSRKHHSMALLLAAARAGWLVATVDYRLAPGVAFPYMLLDCKAALAWLRRHAGAYGGDPRFIAVAGESAGGHLALMLGLTPNVAAYQPPPPGRDASDADVDTSVDAVVDLYGVADWTDSRGRYARRWHAPGMPQGIVPFLEKLVLQRSFSDHTHEFVRASPLWWVQGEALGEALRAAGISVPATAIDTTGGGCTAAENEASALSPEEAASLVRHDEAALAPTGSRAAATGVPPLIADMVVDRAVPPIMVVHGTADTLVPHADSESFWGALKSRRARDRAEATQAAQAPDLFISLPHAHHAFNFISSARALAMGDAVLDWLDCVYAAECARRGEAPASSAAAVATPRL